jgi:hypothetical protein
LHVKAAAGRRAGELAAEIDDRLRSKQETR